MHVRFFSRWIVLGTALIVASACNSPSPSPTAPATSVSTATVAVATTTATATTMPMPAATDTPNTLGVNLVAQYNPTDNVLTIYGVTPGATIVMGGTPLRPPPTPTLEPTLVPTETPTLGPTATRRPPPPSPTPVPPVSALASRGKIVFKTDREGGQFPSAFSFYVMDPDGRNVRALPYKEADALYRQVQGMEGYSRDKSRVVLGERRCLGNFQSCAIYILDTVLNAALINSQDDISTGTWFQERNSTAKDPVWSPIDTYIAFVSNHATLPGCIKTLNVYKGAPQPHPIFSRLTNFCSAGDTGHPSFSPDGGKLTFWSEDSGKKQIYVVDITSEDTADTPNVTPVIISDSTANDWDPLWIK